MTQLGDDSGPCFIAARRELPASGGAVVLVGAPYDGTVSFRPGSRFGPHALRAASDVLEDYDPVLDGDLTDIPWVDAGNLLLPRGAPGPVVAGVQTALSTLLAAGHAPLLLGGEHSVTTGAVAAAAQHYPDLAVIQLDAHADLRRDYFGEQHNHACTMRRCLELVGPDALLQVGIRSGTREEFTELRASARLVEPTPAALTTALDKLGARPLYLTLDLDILDPSQLPGTGTPEPGGITWQQLEGLLGCFSSRRLIAADVVELAPDLDPTGRSAVIAAKAVRSIALLLARARGFVAGNHA